MYCFHRNGLQSYIDHLFLSKYTSDKVFDCVNLPDIDIVSDHLPIRTTISLNIGDNRQGDDNNSGIYHERYPYVDWSKSNMCDVYSKTIAELSDTLPIVNTDAIPNRDSAKAKLNMMCDAMKSIVQLRAYMGRPISGGKGNTGGTVILALRCL